MEEFPNNSQRGQQPPDEKQIEKVITGEVITRRPSGLRRFRRSFIAGDASSVGDHVFWNLLVPAAQDAVLDMGQTFLEMLIKGERGSSRLRNPAAPQQGRGSTSQINYGGLSSGSSGSRLVIPPTNHALGVNNGRFSPNEIILSSRAEAEGLIRRLFEVLEKYPVVTVRDLYSMVGVTADYTDDRWGWSNLDGADVKRVRDGVLLVLPPPEELK